MSGVEDVVVDKKSKTSRRQEWKKMSRFCS